MLLIFISFLFTFSREIPPTDSFEVHTKVASDTLTSDSLRLVMIGEIYISGNKRTKEQIILRELEFKRGDTVRVWKLEEVLIKDRNKLYNTRLFNIVRVYSTISNMGIADIHVELEERWYLFPLLIFDLADPNFNIWWRQRNGDLNRIEYGLRFNQKNFRGRNEELRATVQIGFTKRYELLYSIPYIDRSQKNGIRFFASYATNNNIYYKTREHILQPFELENRVRERLRGGVKWTHRQAFYTTHGLESNFYYTQVEDTVTKINPNYFGDGKTSQRYFSLRYDFRYDYRDIISYPLKGSIVVFSVEKLGFTKYEDLDQWDFTADYIKYSDLGSGFYLANQAKGRFSFPKIQPYYNLRGLGLRQDYVRGYDLNVIEGQGYFLTKNTLRKRIIKGSLNFEKLLRWTQFNKVPFAIYLKSYFDLGYVHNEMDYPENQKYINKLLPGGGFGVDIVTFYDLVLRIEGSMNKEGKSFLFFNIKADIY